MHGSLYAYFESDHDRLEALLNTAAADPDHIDPEAYHEFRKGILRHIGLEEKILMPMAARMRGGVPLPSAEKIRRDHGAIAALMVPPPDRQIVAALRGILKGHNELEEQDQGIYEECERLAGEEIPQLVEQVRAAPEVPLMPYNDAPVAMEAMRRALARAGYDFDDYTDAESIPPP